MLKVLVTCALPTLLVVSQAVGQAPRPRDKGIEVGVGLLVSSEYADLLRAEDSGIRGYLGWVWGEVGFAVPIGARLQVTPRVAMLGSSVHTTIPGFEATPNQSANIVMLSGLSVRGYLAEMRNSAFAEVSVSHVLPFFETFSGLEAESNGVGLGAGVGYRFDRFEVEATYHVVPVRDVVVRTNINTRTPKETDVGGFGVNIRTYF